MTVEPKYGSGHKMNPEAEVVISEEGLMKKQKLRRELSQAEKTELGFVRCSVSDIPGEVL